MAQRGGAEAERRARGDQTRLALIAAGRELFADLGYFGTSTADIVTRAGVGTRGAFYHHFADKAELFKAVYEAVVEDLVRQSSANPVPGEPFDRLVHAFQRFLDGALEPEVQRIMLIDGTAVLGWETRRAIEAESMAAIEAVLRQAMDDGAIEVQPSRELAHILVGALEEGALLVARADDADEARRLTGVVVDRLLAGLVPSTRRGRRALRG